VITVASLDKALYDDYLCLVASIKQQIQWQEVKETTGKLGNEQLIPKWVRIRPNYSATVAFSSQEDKDGTNEQINIALLASNIALIRRLQTYGLTNIRNSMSLWSSSQIIVILL